MACKSRFRRRDDRRQLLDLHAQLGLGRLISVRSCQTTINAGLPPIWTVLRVTSTGNTSPSSLQPLEAVAAAGCCDRVHLLRLLHGTSAVRLVLRGSGPVENEVGVRGV